MLIAGTLPATGGQIQLGSLPPLPDAEGFAGPFAGLSNNALLVAGGANFPDRKPWEGGTKVWYDTVYVLESPDGEWKPAGTLPRPLGYGVSVTTADGVVCVGGSSAEGHFADCFRMSWKNQQLVIDELPPLPSPRANFCGAVVNDVLYVFGGIANPASTFTFNELLSLDLKNPDTGWKLLAPCPGPGRILAVAAGQGGALQIFSGADLDADPDGKPARIWLTDAWQYHPSRGWSQLSDLPRPAVAAPSPAPLSGVAHVLVVGGDDASQLQTAPGDHRGFPREVLAWHSVTDTWVEAGQIPAELHSPVTVPVVKWGDQYVFPSGEVRPGIRTPNGLTLRVEPQQAGFGVVNWGVVGIYLGGMIAVGWWFMKRDTSSTTDGYFRGGQRIPGWVAGLSIFATMLSSITFMSIPARAYATDLSWYLGQLPILWIIPLVAYRYLPFFRQLNVTSAYEFLEQRFNLSLRLFASLSFMLFHIGRIAIVLYLPALALAAVSDIDVLTAILLIGILCLIYTVMGGITAVVWTDAIQAIVLLCGATLCFVLAAVHVDGGFFGMLEMAQQDRKLFQNLQWSSMSVADGTLSPIVLLVAFSFNSLVPYTSGQDVVQRYVTTRDLPTARRSMWLTMWMSVFGSMIFFLLGTAIYGFYRSHPDLLDPAMAQPDGILPFYILQQLPAGISGLVIAAIFAASQSTVSSSLNSIATTWIADFDRRCLRPRREDHVYLAAAKFVVVGVGLVAIGAACWLATSRMESAFKQFNTLIGLTSGPLGGVFAVGVFTRRVSGWCAMAGAVVSATTVFTLYFAKAPVTGLLYAFVGCTVCFVVSLALSLVTPSGREVDRDLKVVS
ncbi:MAG: sodium/solute symporter [Planctomycetaceae bacterium]|nr:sodium/solute symporter [Planctomycetaceae bacterium]